MQEVSPSRVTLRFSEFEVDLCAGELRKQGTKVRLQEQPFQILQALLERPGEVVTREELRQRIWPADTFVDFDHGLYNAIKRLREALGDAADSPRFIETVPKRGYKFIATLEPLAVPPGPELPRPEPQKPPRWKRKTTIAVAACLLVAGLLYPWIAPQIQRLWRLYQLQRLTALPLTTLPGNAWSPTFSPDGSQIAFVWSNSGAEGNDLYVKLIGTDNPLRLTHSGHVGPAAWSPDGRSIAFERCDSNDCGVFLMSPLGGSERKIASVSLWILGSLNWSPNAKQLAVLDANSPSDDSVRLFVLSLDSMEKVLVKSGCNQVRTPAFSPSGDYLAWTCAENWRDVVIYLQRLRDGRVTQLLRGLDGVGSLAWSSDGLRILFTTRYINSAGDLWEVALARPNHAKKLPIAHDAVGIAVSFTGRRLAFQQVYTNTNIWRLDLSNPQAHAEKVVASSREQTAPSFSPDGNQIAFQSTRSGSNEIWVSDSDGSNAVQLTSFGIRYTGTPRWSPDGKLIAFDSPAGGDANIYIVDPHGSVPRKLNVDIHENNLPGWSHDGKWIYFVKGGDGAAPPSLWKVSSEGGHAVQVAKPPAGFFVESPDGRYIYFARNRSLWRINADGTGEQQIQGMPQLSGHADRWTPFGSGIYFVAGESDKAEIDYLDLETHKTRQVYVMDKPPASGWMGGMSISNDGRWLLFAQRDEFSSDLMLVENWP